ncbi:unnamed protein product [Cladocopium goreaui]|uniref:Tyr recombinase domain-containing protein n=1 Tax=Cladocopium goreaui TaxID=2562237 RepID=A0A9P1FG64_9DINO|nr:unnamed protein product [Cladocopium goreaui]
MSIGELKALGTEVAEPKKKLAKLRLELSSLKRFLLEKESGESESSFSFVSEPPLAGPRAELSAAAADLFPQPSWCGNVSCSGSRSSPASTISWERRLEISREVGRFLAPAVRSEYHGSSGREKIPLASRFWLVARSFHGEVLNPIRVFSKWGLAKELVKRGSECGESVFVGLPSQCEIGCAIAVLVCVPFSPWHRQVSRRVLKATLTKPSAVEVLAVPEESREEPQEEAKCMKLWVGLITHELVGHVHWDEDPGAAECAFTLDGVQGFVPFAKSLADAASEHFAFLSAESMEASGLDLKSWTLAWTGVSLENPYPDLDPGMVEAALASGIEKSSLEQMQALVSKGLKKNVKLTDPFLGNLADPLSESEGEVPEEEDGSVFAPISSDPVAAALGKLTEIAGVLAEDRKKKPSVSKLEAALDSAHGGHSEVAVGSGKRFAAAWRAFRVILRDAPGDGRPPFLSTVGPSVGRNFSLFAVGKDALLDRVILDGRPANCLVQKLDSWTASMASATCLVDICVGPGEVLLCSGEDLRDFFYQFKVTPSRTARNTLAEPLNLAEADKVFGKQFEDGRGLTYCGLSSLAMGDTNACEFAQASHLAMMLFHEVLFSHELLHMHGKVPRSFFCGGIITDDLVLLEKCLKEQFEAVGNGFETEKSLVLQLSDEFISELWSLILVGFQPQKFEERSLGLWTLLARGLHYYERWRLKVAVPTHINVLEMKSFLREERLISYKQKHVRCLFGLDSQVCLGALCKGRAGSITLNREMRRNVPHILGSDLYSLFMYFPSAVNRADDPTRHSIPRGPDVDLPFWWSGALHGDFSGHDAWIKGVEEDVFKAPFDLTTLKSTFSPLFATARERHDGGLVKRQLRVEEKLSSRPSANLSSRPSTNLSSQPSAKLSSQPEREVVHAHEREYDILATERECVLAHEGVYNICRADEDLLDEKVRMQIVVLLRGGCFRTLGAAIICCSFSVAVDEGNSHSDFLSLLLQICQEGGIFTGLRAQIPLGFSDWRVMQHIDAPNLNRS